MAKPGILDKFIRVWQAVNAVRALGWGWALIAGGGGAAVAVALANAWQGVPVVAQVGVGVAGCGLALVLGGYGKAAWRERRGHLEDVLDVRIVQEAAMLSETRVEGNAKFWKIYMVVEITFRPTDPTRVATLDFVLHVPLVKPVHGVSSFEIPETHMDGLFKEDMPPVFHYLRAPLRFQGPHTERGSLAFILDPATLEFKGGRENVDHNNSTLRITDHISRRSMTVAASVRT